MEQKTGDKLYQESLHKIKYNPQKSKINFAVPNEKVLRDYSKVLPKVKSPGKIQCTMELLKDKKDIILIGDMKLVTKGLNKDFSRDANLFGHKPYPKLEQLKEYVDTRIDLISDCVHKFAIKYAIMINSI